jgi:hypothetical protein
MNPIKTLVVSVAIFTLSFFGFVRPLYAQLNTGIDADGVAGKAAADAGYSQTDEFTLSKIIGTVVQFAFGFFGILFTVLTVYAGFNWMTAQGDTGKVETAQNTIQQAVIGMIICFSGYGISNFVLNAFFG